MHNSVDNRPRSFVLSHTELRVITHHLSCYHPPKVSRRPVFLYVNQQLTEFPESRNSIFNLSNTPGRGKRAASWGLRPRRLLRPYGPPPAPTALPPGIPLGGQALPNWAPKGGRTKPPGRPATNGATSRSKWLMAPLREAMTWPRKARPPYRALRPGQIAPALSAMRPGRPLSRAAVAAAMEHRKQNATDAEHHNQEGGIALQQALTAPRREHVARPGDLRQGMQPTDDLKNSISQQ